MGFKDMMIFHALQKMVDFVEKSGKIEEVGEMIDEQADKHLKKRSERFQEVLVRKVFIPLSRYLMREDPDKYKKVLQDELNT
jgi:hypothetical protein